MDKSLEDSKSQNLSLEEKLKLRKNLFTLIKKNWTMPVIRIPGSIESDDDSSSDDPG